MKDSIKLKGTIYQIDDEEIISPKYKKRIFILKMEKKVKEWDFTDYVKFQLSQYKCDIIEPYKVGEYVEVEFYVRGRKYQKEETTEVMYFNTLDVYNINPLAEKKKKIKNIEEFDQQGFFPDEGKKEEVATITEKPDDLPF